jgi:dihydrofolate reductase
MRKLIVFMMTSLDGCYARQDEALDWHVVDDEFNTFANEQLDTVDTLLFGRVTYEGMASYWTTTAAAADDPLIAAKMNQFPKLVFSRTLTVADWQNTRLIKENIADELLKLKQQPGKHLIIFGSSTLSASLLNLDLVDELRIMIAPVLLGNGKPLFKGIHADVKLKLVNTKRFQSGNVLLSYTPTSP